MDRPHCCPICNDYRVKTTLRECDITAKFKNDERDVHGLASFTCDSGHIFFVRQADLTLQRKPAGSASLDQPTEAAHVQVAAVIPAGKLSTTVAPTTFDGPLFFATIV